MAEQELVVKATPASVIRSPIVFYWLYQSGILDRIARSIESEYKCEFNYEASTLSPKISNGDPAVEEEITHEIVKELEDLQTASPMQTFDFGSSTDPAEVDERIRRLKEKQQGEAIFVINPQQSHQLIRASLERYQLTALLNEYDNYYSLQNSLYLFAEQPMQQSFVEMLSDGEIEKETTGIGKQDNLLENYAEKIDHKIEHLEICSKLTEFDGVELWNCTYKSIPHTYIKCTRDNSWLEGINKPLLHASHPKTIENLPLLPPLTLLRPRPEHVPTLLSFLGCLHKKYPNHSPQTNSIFENRGRLVIFTKESWLADIGWLCYRVAYGQISYQGYLNWQTNNPKEVLDLARGKAHPQNSILTL